MRRNRLGELQHRKRAMGRQPTGMLDIATHAVWQHDYYHFKNRMIDINSQNTAIGWMVQQYGRNPTVFLLRQIQTKLNKVCRDIDQVQYWSSHFPYSHGQSLQMELQGNLVKHFKQGIMQEIRMIFGHRQRISDISRWVQQLQQHSLNHSLNHSRSFSMDQSQGMERSQVIREVGMRIQNLNIILRRMGDVVQEQGDLVNRIDFNLSEGHQNVKKGRGQLQDRLNRQENGDDMFGEFGCQGRVNSVITTLYVVIIILIAVLFVKNL